VQPTQSPERIPDRLKISINFKVLGLILAGAIIFQVLLYLDQGIGLVEEAQPFIAMATPLLVACAALLIAYATVPVTIEPATKAKTTAKTQMLFMPNNIIPYDVN